VRRAKPFDPEILDRMTAEFHEVVPLPPLQKTMVDIDKLADQIARAEREHWKTDAPKGGPPQDAVVLLHEQFRELLRDPAVSRKPPEFARLLRGVESNLGLLEETLSQPAGLSAFKASWQWKNVQANCAACHARFRDVPQNRVAP
jgi:hypothetical protein